MAALVRCAVPFRLYEEEICGEIVIQREFWISSSLRSNMGMRSVPFTHLHVASLLSA